MSLTLLLAAIACCSVADAATFGRRPYAQNATTSQVVLRWRQSSGTATITYGPKGGATQSMIVASGTEQEVTLANLTGGTRYAYTVDVGGGNTASGEFTTAVQPSESFTFIAYGDNRTNDSDHQTVVNAMVKEGVDFLINTGDVVDVPSTITYDTFFQIESALLAQNVLFTTLGNHEYNSGSGVALWQQQFVNPTASSGTERYYDFDFGNTRFVVLDFNSVTSAQNTWLASVLADAQSRGMAHIFAFMHHSPYDSGLHGENTTAQTSWVPLFSQYGVDLIVGGHDHDYERGYNATTKLRYLVTGGGGAPLYAVNAMGSYQQTWISTNHYVKINVSGAVVTVTAVQPDGTVIDSFMFGTPKTPPSPDMGVAPPMDLAGVDLSAGPPDLTGVDPEPPPPAASGCGCTVGAATPARGGIGWALLGAALLAIVGIRRLRRRR